MAESSRPPPVEPAGPDAGVEFADLWSATDQTPVRSRVPVALHGIDPALPIVDLGAGTGLGTIAVAEAMPDSAVYAVERSPTMRAVLLSRVAVRPDLRQRVTVVPGDIFLVDLPERWGGAIAIHLVCQMSPANRRKLWRLLAERLPAGAVAVIDRHYGARCASGVPERLSSSSRIGEHTYERWYAAEPASADSIRVRNTYRVLRADRLVDEQVLEKTVWVVSESDARAEAAAAGLTTVPFDRDILAVRRG